MLSAKKAVFSVVAGLILAAMAWVMTKSVGDPTTLYVRAPRDVSVFLDDRRLSACNGQEGCSPPEEQKSLSQYVWGIYVGYNYIVEARRDGEVVARVQFEAEPGEAPSILLDFEDDWVEAAPPVDAAGAQHNLEKVDVNFRRDFEGNVHVVP